MSGVDALPRMTREIQTFSRVIVVGGGCYGSYYVRQLARARAANAAEWGDLIVVDRAADCRVSQLAAADRPVGLRLVTDTWEAFFEHYLADAAVHPASAARDAIVPSPLMPHLMAHWLVARARARWPARRVAAEPLAHAPEVPWQRAGDDGAHYVSFAEWMCPINCIEPAKCPATRSERTWSLPPALVRYVEQEQERGRTLNGPFVFHCSHRTHGVGMIDVRDVVAADAAIAQTAEGASAEFLVGTASHCHGALQRIVVGPR